MSRYVAEIETSMDAETAAEVCNAYLRREGFKESSYAGQRVWQKGIGLLMAPQFITLEFADGRVHLEAWVCLSLLPGVYLVEMDTNGFIGGLPKQKLRQRIGELKRILAGGGGELAAGTAGSPGARAA